MLPNASKDLVLRDYVEEAVEVEFVEKETEAVVGEEGTRLEVLQNEGWSFTGVLYKEEATGSSS